MIRAAIGRAVMAALLLATGAGAATAKAPRPAPVAAGTRYVSLGSSFAAGAGIGPIQPGSPPRCQRNTNNYASLLAQRLGLALTDVSCGGATTAHVLGPWSELPAQIEAIGADTGLVTIVIGGNDLGYVGGLMMASCRAAANPPPARCVPPREPSAESYAKVEASMREIARQVATRAPRAQLVFVQYMTLVADGPCPGAALPAGDLAISRGVGLRLAEITRRVARDSGALVLDADKLSRNHTVCSADPWSGGMAGGTGTRQGMSWHPNATGHAAVADALAKLLTRR